MNIFTCLHSRYFETGVCSVYLWDLDHGFAGVVLIKKAGDTEKIKGCWDSIHVVEVQVGEGGGKERGREGGKDNVICFPAPPGESSGEECSLQADINSYAVATGGCGCRWVWLQVGVAAGGCGCRWVWLQVWLVGWSVSCDKDD